MFNPYLLCHTMTATNVYQSSKHKHVCSVWKTQNHHEIYNCTSIENGRFILFGYLKLIIFIEINLPADGPPSGSISPELFRNVNSLLISRDNRYNQPYVILFFTSESPIVYQIHANQCAISANMRMRRMRTAAPYSM